MKKIWLMVMSVLLIFGMLSGCAPAEPATEEPGPVIEQPEGEKPAVEEPAVEEPGVVEPITLEYWQVDFQGWDTGIQAAIDLFEAEYDNIKVVHVPVSYDEINEKIAAMVPVGEGPDIINAFFGWVPLWVKSGFLVSLPADRFDHDYVREIYMPVVEGMFLDGELYGLPFNQGNWAIWYNVDMFEEAGITKLPETYEELRQAAIACTKRSANGDMEVAGYYVEFGTQEHILWKQMTIQNGQQIFSDDLQTVIWNQSEAGAESFKWLTDLIMVDKVMDIGFGEGPGQAFMLGEACMRLGSPSNLPVIRATVPDLNFNAFPLPRGTASDPEMANSNQTQYWSINVTTKAVQDSARAEAAYLFMEFLMRPEVALAMIEGGFGGLPAHASLLDHPTFQDPQLAAFLETLPNSKPLSWVDEKAERDISVDMGQKVYLNNEDPYEVFEWGTIEHQKIRDEFFGN